MRTLTVGLDHDIDPIAVGTRTGLVWARQDVALAGVGTALRIPVARPEGGQTAQRILGEMRGEDHVGVPGTGPVGFGAFPFEQTAPGELIVPRNTVGVRGDQRWLTVISEDPARDVDTARDELEAVADAPLPADPATVHATSVIPPSEWMDMVDAVRSEIKSGSLNKAVLAREIRVAADGPHLPRPGTAAAPHGVPDRHLVRR